MSGCFRLSIRKALIEKPIEKILSILRIKSIINIHDSANNIIIDIDYKLDYTVSMLRIIINK